MCKALELNLKKICRRSFEISKQFPSMRFPKFSVFNCFCCRQGQRFNLISEFNTFWVMPRAASHTDMTWEKVSSLFVLTSIKFNSKDILIYPNPPENFGVTAKLKFLNVRIIYFICFIHSASFQFYLYILLPNAAA